MKEREFHLRLDLSTSANMGRLHAFLRSIDRSYQPMRKLKRGASLKRIRTASHRIRQV